MGVGWGVPLPLGVSSGCCEVAVCVFWSVCGVAVVVVVSEVPLAVCGDWLAAAPAVDGFACVEAALPCGAGLLVGGSVAAVFAAAACLVAFACAWCAESAVCGGGDWGGAAGGGAHAHGGLLLGGGVFDGVGGDVVSFEVVCAFHLWSSLGP